MRKYLLLLVLIYILNSCDSQRVFEENIEIPDKMWLADSSLNFQFEINSTRDRYNLFYNVRNGLSYPFQNLYIQCTVNDTLGNQVKNELINQNLFDPKTGRPFGSGLGDVFDHQFPILTNYRFNRVGIYEVNIKHYMRPDTLKEIMAIGVRLEHVRED